MDINNNQPKPNQPQPNQSQPTQAVQSKPGQSPRTSPLLKSHMLKKKPAVHWYEWVIVGLIFLILSYICGNWIIGVFIHHRAVVQVPDLKGKSLMFALDRLGILQIALIKEDEEFNQALPEGSILRQTPVPGTLVREGKTVRVVLSKGGEKVFVHDLINMPLRLAEIDLRQSNLALGEVSERFSLSASKGNVVDQDPAPGSVVERHTLIHVVISSGEPPDDIILMPDFIGKKIDEVKLWASDKKIPLDKIISDPYSAVPKDEVIRQIPQPDTILGDKQNLFFVVGVSTAIAEANRVWQYALPQGSGMRNVVIKLVYENQENLIFKGKKLPGSKLEIPYHHRAGAHIQVYLDGILIEESNAD
ncbi:MAG: PASTA domain-containing protein [bacterium]